IDPLIKMAIIHHQFESIHPFYDGNGRTGRIIAILYLVVNDLLDLPILYLSRYITHNKGEYYRLIQRIRDNAPDNAEVWEKWILFILKGVEETSIETIRLVKSISALMAKYKNILKPLFGKQYKHELLNNLFFHPYTKIEFMERDMSVQRKTATKYLDTIVSETGLLQKQKLGRSNYYINTELMELFIFRAKNSGGNVDFAKSVKE
ncbi:MAG: Fic family protein, partial [Sodaliphilus sp.]